MDKEKDPDDMYSIRNESSLDIGAIPETSPF